MADCYESTKPNPDSLIVIIRNELIDLGHLRWMRDTELRRNARIDLKWIRDAKTLPTCEKKKHDIRHSRPVNLVLLFPFLLVNIFPVRSVKVRHLIALFSWLFHETVVYIDTQGTVLYCCEYFFVDLMMVRSITKRKQRKEISDFSDSRVVN